jgi:tRNA dimethylallyltransferase
VTGPTGAGKSALAVALALRLGGEVVGADAFQTYAGLPILTAQPTEDLLSLVPHHLIGILDLNQGFDAAMYAQAAWRCIRDIESRGRVPILTGGTGLYLKALTHGLVDMPKANADLRARITALPVEDVLAELCEKDPEAPASIDTLNPLRVRRALEIVLLTGRPLAESRSSWSQDKGLFRGLVLTRDREDLRSRIAANVETMFASGVVNEVQAASYAGEGAARAIGFRKIQDLLRGEITKSECKAAIVLATQRYAKRQLTWGRTQFTFPILNLSGFSTPEAALSAALDILNSPLTPEANTI